MNENEHSKEERAAGLLEPRLDGLPHLLQGLLGRPGSDVRAEVLADLLEVGVELLVDVRAVGLDVLVERRLCWLADSTI